MESVRKFLFKWVVGILFLVAYVAFRSFIGWDEQMDWSRFSELAALGTLGLFLLTVYTGRKAD